MQLEPENNHKNEFITELGRLIALYTKVVPRVCRSIIKKIIEANKNELINIFIYYYLELYIYISIINI